MTIKPRAAKERCAICGGELKKKTITHEVRHGTKVHLFQHVPAQVCSACGEIWIEESVLQEIDRLMKEGEPVRIVETPVYDLAPAGMR